MSPTRRRRCLFRGRYYCVLKTVLVVCDAERGNPVTTCNNIDDDCDGQTDESFPNIGKAARSRGFVRYLRTSTFVCAAIFRCNVYDRNSPSDEQCNGLDDDL